MDRGPAWTSVSLRGAHKQLRGACGWGLGWFFPGSLVSAHWGGTPRWGRSGVFEHPCRNVGDWPTWLGNDNGDEYVRNCPWKSWRAIAACFFLSKAYALHAGESNAGFALHGRHRRGIIAPTIWKAAPTTALCGSAFVPKSSAQQFRH